MADSDQDGQVRVKIVRVMEVSRMIRHLTTWLGVIAVAMFIFKSIEVLAGRKTFADVLVRYVGELNIGQYAAWLLAGGGTLFGMRQRTLRRRAIKRLQGRIRKLEERLDPGRSSSRLDEEGRTPEDDL